MHLVGCLLPQIWFINRNYGKQNQRSVEGVQDWVHRYKEEGKRIGKRGFVLKRDIAGCSETLIRRN